MQVLLRYARIFFALDLIGLGLQLFLTGHFSSGLPPVPPTFVAGSATVHAFALLLMVLAAGLLWRRSLATCALLLGLVYTGSALVLHAHPGEAAIRNGSLRTGLFEALAIGAALLVLFSIEARPPRALAEAPMALGWIGFVLFALSIAVFGEQHFEYARYVASLVPAWIPQHLFWARFTGACMLAAALGFFFPPRAALAGILLGTMFLLWFVVLHLPRVLAAPHSRDEWSSAIIVMAFADASWIVAAGRFFRKSAPQPARAGRFA